MLNAKRQMPNACPEPCRRAKRQLLVLSASTNILLSIGYRLSAISYQPLAIPCLGPIAGLFCLLSIGLAQYQSPAALVEVGFCPKTPKGWLESPFPIQELRLAGQKLDSEGIRQSLRAGVGLRSELVRELAAVKLNLALGVESSAIVLSVAQAERWLRVPSREEQWVGLLRDALEAFNRGRYGVCR